MFCSIYPACLAPYLLVTASTDNMIRFWTAVDKSGGRHEDFAWEEWRMETEHGSSAIQVPGTPLSVSAAYTGRIAVAYRSGQSFSRKHAPGGGGGSAADSDTCYVNLFVAIYECESSGGIEWILEDKIVLKNIEVPRIEPALDPSVLEHGGERQDRRSTAFAKLQKKLYDGSKIDAAGGGAGGGSETTASRMTRVPSQATLSKLKEGLAADLPSHNLVQKQLVQLDWVSNEDGSHILTVAVANKVMLLTTVSSEISEACKVTLKEKKPSTARPLLRKSSSIGLQPVIDELKWMIFRKVELQTADGLPPLPMSVSWARDGVLLCAMDNEVAVYCQWRSDLDSSARASGSQRALEATTAEDTDHRRLKEEDLLNIVNDSQMKPLKVGLKLKSGLDLAQSEERLRQMVGTSHLTEEDFMPGMGLFEASHLACPVLPQYHPKQLMELLNSGKIKWVKAILNHLVKCISPGGHRTRGENSFSGLDLERNSRDWTKSRTLSLSVGPSGSSPSPSGEHKKNSTSAMPEELTLDYAEIRAVPPMPLWMLLEADKEKPRSAVENQEYSELFSESIETEVMNFDIIIEDEDSNRRSRRPSMSAEKQQGLSFFGPRQARVLSKLLTHSQLPGLTSLDQMHLMALADTVASCNVDIAERLAIDAAITAMSKETMSGAPGTGGDVLLDSLDDCGLRFLLAMKHHCYLQKCLPLSQRAVIAKQGLATSNIIWGFHSESEEELVSMIPCVAKNAPTWPELRELGVVWWVRSNAILRKLVESLARTAFQNSQEPLDAALYYLAIKKKSMVWGLYRSIRDEKMTQFFKNDFSEERWRKAALKNAFALLGKQRFHHAAAFFLLSGSLKDAMEIILSKLEDLQLAILIGRLYDGATENFPLCVQNILKDNVLGFGENGDEIDLHRAHPDPFLRSIGHWILKDYEASLTTLLLRNVGHDHPSFASEDLVVLGSKKSEADPLVFNFYVFLRTHPLIVRQRLTRHSEDKNKALMLQGFKMGSFDKGSAGQADDSVTPLERKLFFSTASFHLRGGCPALALEVLSKLPANLAPDAGAIPKAPSQGGGGKVDKALMETGRLDETAVDWGRLGRVSPPAGSKKEEESKAAADTGGLLDWGASLSDKIMMPEEDELKLEWSEDEEDEEDDDDGGKTKLDSKAKAAAKNLGGANSFSLQDEAGGGGSGQPEDRTIENLDIIAQQMKFTACLKIMMEELSTLATGFEQEGGLIRCQLYIWLEKEVEALKKLCNYNVAESFSEADSTSTTAAAASTTLASDSDNLQAGENVPSLHEVILSENQDFETRQLRASRRKKWLAANQPLLRTLLSYCSLHGANGGGLVNVRLELVLLLQVPSNALISSPFS
jgi:hypothetical protein